MGLQMLVVIVPFKDVFFGLIFTIFERPKQFDVSLTWETKRGVQLPKAKELPETTGSKVRFC